MADKSLYVERWLLRVKTAALAAGLTAHARALDAKGGQLLALEMGNGHDALELRYRKRARGPHIVAACTGVSIFGPARQVFEKVLADHCKLLENGFRRFLRSSLDVLNLLAAAIARDPGGVRGRVTGALGGDQAGARPAVVVQPGKKGHYQVYPAVARPQGNSYYFWAWDDGRFFDLSNLFGGQQGNTGMAAGPEGVGPAPAAAGAGSIGNSVELSLPSLAAVATGAAMGGLVDSGNAARAGAGAGMQGPSGDVLEGLVNVADAAGGVVEVVAGASSCLGDASCSGIDLGGLDCNF